jgi:hypothetical protein
VRVKRVKTFAATWRPAGGRVRVVLVQEARGWLAPFSTDPALTAEEIPAASFGTPENSSPLSPRGRGPTHPTGSFRTRSPRLM